MASPLTLVCAVVLCTAAVRAMMMPNRVEVGDLVIDTFDRSPFNDLGFWHGPGENLQIEYSYDDDGCYVQLSPSDPDHNYHTQLSNSCFDLSDYEDMYLHVRYSGSSKFSISLYQNNGDCNADRAPYPGTSDSVEASRYAVDDEDIYVPLSHFYIDLTRASSIAFHGFYTSEDVYLRIVELVDDIPSDIEIPRKLPTGTMVLNCRRPDSFAFGIDDGDPQLAQEVMEILEDEGIKVTFFVVGKGLVDESTNLTNVYAEMLRRGHQVALHSYSHPKMEGLLTEDDIDSEILDGFYAVEDRLGVHSRYFRPPYGTVGARMRQRLAAFIDDPYIVNWSVDIEDWIWANSRHPEKQLAAFQRDVARGGDIVVMHYLSWSTVQYFRDVIQVARETGKRIMRIDQCMMDPEAPPVEDEFDVDIEGTPSILRVGW